MIKNLNMNVLRFKYASFNIRSKDVYVGKKHTDQLDGLMFAIIVVFEFPPNES